MQPRHQELGSHVVTPGEIRRRGFSWPLPGIQETAYPTNAEGRVDLQSVLTGLRQSQALWQREHSAARQMAGRASRDSYGDYDDLKTARTDLGAKVGGIQDAIAELERLMAHLDRVAARNKAWLRSLLGVYLLAALVGSVLLMPVVFGTSAQLPRLQWSEEMPQAEAAARGEHVRSGVYAALPSAAFWLAPSALFWFDDRVDRLISPNDWARRNTTLRERVDDVNECIDDIPLDLSNTASLMAAIFAAGLLLGGLAAWRPGLGTAVMICLPPLFATKIATAPLIGVNNEDLLYWTLPMLVAGAGFLAMQIARAMKTGLVGRRGDDWLSVWLGAGLFVMGTGVTVVGVLLVTEFPGGGVLATAVAPALYGLYLLGRGLWGLVRSAGKGRS